MDTRHDRKAGQDPPSPTEAELLAAMEQSDQDVEAGLTVSLDEVLADLDESLVRIEARRRARRA
jgi:hypothetical protein